LTAIVILALVAVFIGLRLYSVLGERTGHEQQLPRNPVETEPALARMAEQTQVRTASLPDPADNAFLPTAGPGVRALLAADSSFDVARFLEGAQSAYRMILEAFWKGDLSEVQQFLDRDVQDTFGQAIVDRQAAGHRLDNRLVAIEQAVIAAATLEGKVARVAVRFEADIAAVTRNAEGEVIAGSLSDAVQTRDVWTFRRDLANRDPNWLLIETDEEE
jgi:predicted lipid-binding transport protein (Tim44 family)